MMQTFFKHLLRTPTIVLLLAALTMTISASAQKSEKDKLQNKKKNLEQEISNTNSLLEQTKKAKQTSLNQLALVEGQIKNQQQMVGLIQEEVVGINKEMSALIDNIKSLQRELDLLKKEYIDMIYFSYLTRSSHNRMMFLFASENINEAYQRYRYLQEYANSRKRQAELIVAKQEDIKQSILKLDEIKSKKFNLLKQQESEVHKLNTQKKEKNKTVQELKTQEQEEMSTIY